MNEVPTQLTLYGTSACHLCELAEQLLQPLEQAGACRVSHVDISQSDTLMERYGVRIPVLRRDNGAELGWPFDARELAGFLD